MELENAAGDTCNIKEMSTGNNDDYSRGEIDVYEGEMALQECYNFTTPDNGSCSMTSSTFSATTENSLEMANHTTSGARCW